MLGETQAEYDRLLDDLHKQFEPVGRAEELEVERITVCWWKFQRAWRYENSADHIKLVRVAQEIKQLEKTCKARNQEREAIILGLENMIGELSVARELPPDLKQKFFVLTSTKEQDWQKFETIADEDLKAKASRTPELASFLSSPKDRRQCLASLTLRAAKRSYELELELVPSDINICLGQYTIPSRDDLEKILRYDTATDRNLGRALNRLERLQRHRKGESVPPPVSVHLTL